MLGGYGYVLLRIAPCEGPTGPYEWKLNESLHPAASINPFRFRGWIAAALHPLDLIASFHQ